MNRKFIFSLALAMSFILESGFAIASQTALAVQFSYPYSSSSYNKVYSPNNNTSSSYDNTSYNKVYSPNNNTSSSYDNTSYNKVYNIYNNDKNDEYPDSYSKPAGYSKYPTIDKIYECQTGQLEGFFTSSVEFCIAANENVR
jgi:hypothetical protein